MLTSQRALLRSALFASSILSTVVAVDAGHAQAAPDVSAQQPAPQVPGATSIAPATPQPGESGQKAGEIVVTGSRIRRSNLDTPSEVNVITKDSINLNGGRDIASILQSSSVTSGGSQVNGAFLGFVSENGPAANTVGLRGLGSSRTLVLLNGRRLSPAGVGPQLVAADLNVLPAALVDRVEILREGASSVYGSDAIGGVINIITDNKIEGITVEGYDNMPSKTGGAGNSMRASIAAGHVFDRGHITASFEYRRDAGLITSDRKGFSCPRDLLFDPTTGAEVGATDPATGQLSCFPYSLGSGSGIASGYGIAQSFTLPASRLAYTDLNTFRMVNGLERVSPSRTQLENTVLSPLKTYTGYLNGSYELGILGDAEVYGEALFTRRESHQVNPQQFSITQASLSPDIQIYGGSYAGTPLSAYGYPTSPFFPNSLAAAGYNVFTPFILPTQLQHNSQRIDYIRANGGMRGSLGLGDWHYDANFQYSHTHGISTITQTTNDRVSNALQAVLAPAGTPSNLTTTAIAGEAGAGNAYTCAANVAADGTFIPGSTCVPFDMYNPAALNGVVPSNVYNYLFKPETERTNFKEEIASINFDGTLFRLPGGAVKMSVGYEHRFDAIDDVPSIDAQNAQLYNYSSAGITKGSVKSDEVYGELSIPLLKDRPWVKLAEIDLSGRYTHNQAYGSDFTYTINGQYAPNDIVRFRGNYGTSFRAPNLYEQFVANQTGFQGSGVDPCDNFGQVADPNSARFKNCSAVLSAIPGALAADPKAAGGLNYTSTAGPEEITEGGAGRLKAETAVTWGGGIVLTAPKRLMNLSLSVDYFNIRVKGEINQLGTTILSKCYDATDFGAANPYCALIGPREVGGAHPGAITSFQNPYLNVALQKTSGIDFDLEYSTPIAGSLFSASVQATRNLHQEYQPFVGEAITDYNGTLGEQGFGAGPKWVGNLDAEWTDRDRFVTFHYGLKYVGVQDSRALIGPYVAGLGLGPVDTILRTKPYFEHAASVKFHFTKLGDFTIGVTNFTNSHPPIISQLPTTDGAYVRIGNYFDSSNYDYYGRSFFMHFSKNF
jgi:outer membrane receptor protein involved in Fe transport